MPAALIGNAFARIYSDLFFRATGKYAVWNPETSMKVGDHGRITRADSRFCVETAYCVHPPFVQYNAGAAFKCTFGRGVVLVMKNTAITAIKHAGALRHLLADPSMRGMVVVSKVHLLHQGPHHAPGRIYFCRLGRDQKFQTPAYLRY
ncbi:hypothetical protein MSAN_01144000 [Mycena sanguinolenta]|uniref:Uncharacterized protein n=1 Tax=Mycena sanguinolenta TaxID=230812 RepID=A0A8H7D6G3_9AGAR|nr:hypothetical protein MSAN_01144000 [Mycena sanguinolenta]